MVAASAAISLAGCDRFAARLEFKKGNAEYKNESYRAAIENYRRGLALDPEAKKVWRSLGLAAMAIYRPGDKAPTNVEYARSAIDAFEHYLRAFPDDDQVREYLLTTLLNTEKFDDALERLESEAKIHPDQVKIEEGIVSVLIRAKRFDDAETKVRRLGDRATFLMNYSLGVACWDKAYRDPTLDAAARGKVVDTGIATLRQAAAQKPDSFEANVYYNLILREKAKLELDPDKQQELIAEALRYQEKAKALAKVARAQAG